MYFQLFIFAYNIMQSNRAKRDVEIVPCIRKQLFFYHYFLPTQRL